MGQGLGKCNRILKEGTLGAALKRRFSKCSDLCYRYRPQVQLGGYLKIILSVLILVGLNGAAMADDLPTSPYLELIIHNINDLVVNYNYSEDDESGGVPDPWGVHGKSYTEALKIVSGQFSKRPSWKCKVNRFDSNKHFCYQTFIGGNFDGRRYFDFIFYFLKDSSGSIQLEKYSVDALLFYD